MKNNKKQNSLPLISVIMPVRNEENFIKSCVEKILSQSYPLNKIEVLVIDGMSEDKTRTKIEELIKTNSGTNIKIFDNHKKARSSALNIGIRNAKGEIVIRIDARTIISKDYIRKCVITLLKTGADNVGGIQRPMPTKGTQQAIGLVMSHPFGVGNAQFRLGKKSSFVDSVYLGCFKKDIFKKIGFFDESSGIISEDSDINYRIKKAGGKVYLNKDVIAYYYPRDNFKDLWKLYFRYGGSRAGNFYKHKVLKARQFIPLIFLISLALTGILSFFSSYFFILFCIILISYFVADFVSSLSITRRIKNIKLLPSLFISFPCMHFSWSLGFITRLSLGPCYKKDWKY
ncbi:glycosyltransferase family 2 protein [bacterium]|nr:MAG: glycosyltransferase family 2 protein [bacterium]